MNTTPGHVALSRRLPLALLLVAGLALILTAGVGAAPRTEVVSPRIFQVEGTVGPMSVRDVAASGQALIQVSRTVATPDLAAALEAQGFNLVRRFNVGSVALVGLPEGMSVNDGVTIVRRLPVVQAAEPDRLFYLARIPNDPRYSQQYQYPLIQAPEAWDVFTGSSSTVVAIIDSGVDYTHPDLSSRIWVNTGEIPGNSQDDDMNGYVDDVRGWNFGDGNNDPMDEDGHGTHVAGAVGAATNNGIGVAGTDWACRLMPLKVMDEEGLILTSAIIEAIEYATDNGADVINMSLQGPFSESLDAPIAAAWAAGVVVVAAAGNWSVVFTDNPDTWVSPVCNDGPFSSDNYVLGVAACDEDREIAWFSNLDNSSRNFVDVVGPGVNTLSTLPGSSYGQMSGTSMASPIVAGVAALVRGLNPGSSAAAVIDLIRAGAVNIDTQNPDKIGMMGRGLVNAVRALADVPPGPARNVRAFDTPNDQGGSITVTWQRSVDDGGGFNDVEGYRVYRSDTSTGPFTLLADLPARSTMYIDSPVPDETPFWYRVDVYDAKNVTPSPIVGPAMARDDLPPHPVDTLTAADTPGDMGGSITLDWTGYEGPPDLDHFNVYRAEASFSDVSGMTALASGLDKNTTSYVDDTTTDGVRYWYAVAPVDHVGNENRSVSAVGPVRSYPNLVFRFPAGLSMISLPTMPETLDMGAILGIDDSGRILLARWNPATESYVRYEETPASPFLRQALGRGFWVRCTRTTTVDVAGTVAPAGDFTLDVEPGWNMIGNPFTEPVVLGDARVTYGGGTPMDLGTSNLQGRTADYAWAWSGGSYRLISPILPPPVLKTIDRGRGIFFRSYVPARLTFKRPTGAMAVEEPEAVAAPPSERDWTLRLVAASGEARDTDNFLGVSPRAAELNYVISPPLPEAGVDLYFVEAERQGESVATSFVAPDTRQPVWEVAVASAQPGSEVTLTWPDLTTIPNSVRPVLTDLATGRSIYLRTAASYRFRAEQEPRRFQLTLAQEGAVMLTSVSASSAAGRAQVVYTLAAPAQITAEVLNISGRVVRVICQSRLQAAGVSTLTWDGRNATGAAAPPGTYLVRLTAENDLGQRTSVVRALSLQR